MTDFYMKCNTGLKWVKFDKYFFKTFPIFSLGLPETLTKRTVAIKLLSSTAVSVI